MTVAEYNHCVNEYADRLYRFVLKNIRNVDDARDIVQDTFEKMWAKHNSVETTKARSYLFTAAYHTLIDLIRKKKHMADLSVTNTIMDDNTSEYSNLKEALEWALSCIPEIQRSVILLRDYEGYSYQEIGEITGLGESQVKVYIYRGRMALRKLIGKHEIFM